MPTSLFESIHSHPKYVCKKRLVKILLKDKFILPIIEKNRKGDIFILIPVWQSGLMEGPWGCYEQGGSGRTSIINDFSNEYIPEISAIDEGFHKPELLKDMSTLSK
jgi:hypothetical protein